ncbi:hypothetical protein JQ604_37705 [Bradyrhizobium jicamae]|uniref:hypothetical protein n=1 Tax=Bradyrhizobium jicamae TaxID=280332 RepID=UPI001BA7CED0|nr:hypothetical protein [Bradyrhizobium jicamae]MBR0757950.1 hypothetical protein [Bradyrhizobium jicamae]
MFQLLRRWKIAKLALVCPSCKEVASAETYRRGRYLIDDEPLICEHCHNTAPVTFWRFAGFSQNHCSKGRHPSAMASPALQPRPSEQHFH